MENTDLLGNLLYLQSERSVITPEEIKSCEFFQLSEEVKQQIKGFDPDCRIFDFMIRQAALEGEKKLFSDLTLAEMIQFDCYCSCLNCKDSDRNIGCPVGHDLNQLRRSIKKIGLIEEAKCIGYWLTRISKDLISFYFGEV